LNLDFGKQARNTKFLSSKKLVLPYSSKGLGNCISRQTQTGAWEPHFKTAPVYAYVVYVIPT